MRGEPGLQEEALLGSVGANHTGILTGPSQTPPPVLPPGHLPSAVRFSVQTPAATSLTDLNRLRQSIRHLYFAGFIMGRKSNVAGAREIA